MNTIIKIELSLSDYFSFDPSPCNPDLATTQSEIIERASELGDLMSKKLQAWLDQSAQRKDFGIACVSECVGTVADGDEELEAARRHETALNDERLREPG